MHTFEYFRHTIPGNYNLHIFKFLNIFGYSIYRCAVRHDEKNNLLLFKQLKETMIFFRYKVCMNKLEMMSFLHFFHK